MSGWIKIGIIFLFILFAVILFSMRIDVISYKESGELLTKQGLDAVHTSVSQPIDVLEPDKLPTKNLVGFRLAKQFPELPLFAEYDEFQEKIPLVLATAQSNHVTDPVESRRLDQCKSWLDKQSASKEGAEVVALTGWNGTNGIASAFEKLKRAGFTIKMKLQPSKQYSISPYKFPTDPKKTWDVMATTSRKFGSNTASGWIDIINEKLSLHILDHDFTYDLSPIITAATKTGPCDDYYFETFRKTIKNKKSGSESVGEWSGPFEPVSTTRISKNKCYRQEKNSRVQEILKQVQNSQFTIEQFENGGTLPKLEILLLCVPDNVLEQCKSIMNKATQALEELNVQINTRAGEDNDIIDFNVVKIQLEHDDGWTLETFTDLKTYAKEMARCSVEEEPRKCFKDTIKKLELDQTTKDLLDLIETKRKIEQADLVLAFAAIVETKCKQDVGQASAIGATPFRNIAFVNLRSNGKAPYIAVHELGHLLASRHHNDNGKTYFKNGRGFVHKEGKNKFGTLMADPAENHYLLPLLSDSKNKTCEVALNKRNKTKIKLGIPIQDDFKNIFEIVPHDNFLNIAVGALNASTIAERIENKATKKESTDAVIEDLPVTKTEIRPDNDRGPFCGSIRPDSYSLSAEDDARPFTSVKFDTGKAELNREARDTLNEVALSAGSTRKGGDFYLFGFADCTGSVGYNTGLSDSRIVAVREFILSHFKDTETRDSIKFFECPKGNVYHKQCKTDPNLARKDLRRVDIVFAPNR